MITITGVEVLPEGTTAPTIYDIGYQLGALIRFGGAVRRPWSVLEHSYACSYYALYCGDSLAIQLHALLHDAHECVTGDIPRPWKTEDMRVRQRDLDIRIYRENDIPVPTAEEAKRVHEIDNALILAETVWLGPPHAKVTEPPDERAFRAIGRVQALVAYTKVEIMAKHYVAMVESLRTGAYGPRAELVTTR